MQYYTDMDSYMSNEKTAVTLGKFDSLHRGHQKLINRVSKIAKRDSLKSVVFAFDMGKESLLTKAERKEHLKQNIDYMIQCPFTKEIREMEAEVFIETILVNRLHASSIVVGADFRFGHKKRGDVKMLALYAEKYNYSLEVLDKEMYKGREISSTFVREVLGQGNVALAEELLGYAYHLEGIVEHGRKLGRTLGFPTMNVSCEAEKILPAFGVYTCLIDVDEEVYEGIGNVGIKPTVTEQARPLTEVYALGYEGDAYGKKVRVRFCSFVRPEQKFNSVQELKKQVDLDIRHGEHYFRSRA